MVIIWVEKKSAGPLFSYPDKWKHQPYPGMNNNKQPWLFRGWGKTGPAHSFPTLTSVSINLVQKLGYLGGEKLGWPILSPTRIGKASHLPCHEYANNLCFSGDGEKLSPPRQDRVSTLCRWLSEWRKTRLVRYFPILTSESIILTLSRIHIPILLFMGWGNTGPAHSFPTWLVKVSILSRS